MKVFISWSGDTGGAFAKILHSWLPSVLQAVKLFYSPDDIEKGARWSGEIGTELEASHVGIIVVTQESLSSPWVMFEAGALSKNVGRARVAPILVDLAPSDVRGPLVQFQCARFEESEIKRLLRMLNSELKDLSLTEDVLESAFAMWWPTLAEKVRILLQNRNGIGSPNVRSDRELLEEILGLSRSIAQRQSGDVETPTSDLRNPPWSGNLTLESVQGRLKSGGNLAGANLMNLNLANLDMSAANLRGSNMVKVNLSGANLQNADLDGANLEGAVLDGAKLRGARISRVNFWRASMRDVCDLSSVKSMDEANFFGTILNDFDKEAVAKHNTLSISNYPDLIDHFQTTGMTKDQLRDVFLWTAHSYPGAMELGWDWLP